MRRIKECYIAWIAPQKIKALWWIPDNQFVADRGSWSRSRFLQEEWTRKAVWRGATNT